MLVVKLVYCQPVVLIVINNGCGYLEDGVALAVQPAGFNINDYGQKTTEALGDAAALYGFGFFFSGH